MIKMPGFRPGLDFVMRRFCFLFIFLCLSVVYSYSQECVKGAFYVKFKDGINDFVKVETRSVGINSRRVPNECLFGKSTKGFSEDLSGYALSLHIGDAMQNYYKIEFENVDDNDALFEKLQQHPDIEYVERIYSSKIDYVEPNDEYFALEGEANGHWHLDQIGYREVYGKYSGNPDIKVAVIDNAVWGEHPDLQIPKKNQYFAYIDEEGNSAPPSNVSQFDILSTDKNSAVAWSHGTHCAGIIAAKTDNGEGVASVASGVTLLAARAADLIGSGVSKGTECILWAVDRGAKVISLSWGNYFYSQVEENMFRQLAEDGVIIVAASGNENVSELSYPAAYDGVISVASVDSDNSRSSFSNYGEWVDIAAPGGCLLDENGQETSTSILSTTYSISYVYNDNPFLKGKFYDGKSGTSMATPLTASVIALMVSLNPELGADDVLKILKETSVKVSYEDLPINPESGVVNVAAAMEKVAQTVGVEESKKTVPEFEVVRCGEFLNIMSSSIIDGLELYNLSGTLVKSFESKSSEYSLNLSDLKDSFYLLKVNSGDRTRCVKVIR